MTDQHSDVVQEKAYIQLMALYQISKLLSSFENVEFTFPKILTYSEKTFPLLTAVLVHNWEKNSKTTTWHSDMATHKQVVSAVLNAREIFNYLSGASPALSEYQANRYIVLPLVGDNHSVIGALQLEGARPLDEQDLEFVDSLANLIVVALDRHYKTKKEYEIQQIENRESFAKITDSHEQIVDLEDERVLREGFVSLLTHDLRTPLAAAKMSAQLILKQENVKESDLALVNRIVRNINRADQMIENLLDANRLRSGERLPLQTKLFDLTSLIKETLEELKLVYGDRFVFNSIQKIEGVWDPKGLRRIIENLCSNAIKYGDANKPVTVSLVKMQNSVEISVQNFGGLISEKDQSNIFKQFKRTSQAIQSKKSGWGIGLSLVRGVAEAHGGSVRVKSNAESGTVFTVTLPKTHKL